MSFQPLSAYHGHVNVVERLISAKANLDLKDSIGNTALILAAYHGHEEIVKRLISAGADPNLENIDVTKASDHARDDDIKLYLNVCEFLFPTSIKLNISSISVV